MKKVLIIDDDPYLTDVLSELLNTDNIHCDVMNSADEVQKKWSSLQNYDVILLDIMMMRGTLNDRGEDHLETGEILFKRIRESFPKKRIIVISAKDVSSMEIKFEDESFVDVIQKPLDEASIHQLTELIEAI